MRRQRRQWICLLEKMYEIRMDALGGKQLWFSQLTVHKALPHLVTVAKLGKLFFFYLSDNGSRFTA